MNSMLSKEDRHFLDLLQRWLRGDFRRADERDLKSLTDSDDFRREALEGFAAMPEADHEARLLVMRERLRAQTRPASGRVVAMQYWMAAAAAMVLLVAAIWFLPDFSKDEAQSSEAAPQVEPAPEIASKTFSDSNLGHESDIAAHTSERKLDALPNASLPPKPETSATSDASPSKLDEEVPPNTLDNAGESNASQAGAVPADDKQKPADEVQSTLAKPAAPASGAPPIAQTEQYSRANPATKNAEPASAPAQAKKKESVQRHQTDAKPDMAKVRRQTADELPDKAEPLGGWAEFQEHLRQNARLTAEARNHNISGTVRLQFVLDAQGEPGQFAVIQSLGYGCDEEAIRLVKDFEWVRGKNNLISVDVKFVR